MLIWLWFISVQFIALSYEYLCEGFYKINPVLRFALIIHDENVIIKLLHWNEHYKHCFLLSASCFPIFTVTALLSLHYLSTSTIDISLNSESSIIL